jgi:hypothetical protein
MPGTTDLASRVRVSSPVASTGTATVVRCQRRVEPYLAKFLSIASHLRDGAADGVREHRVRGIRLAVVTHEAHGIELSVDSSTLTAPGGLPAKVVTPQPACAYLDASPAERPESSAV